MRVAALALLAAMGLAACQTDADPAAGTPPAEAAPAATPATPPAAPAATPAQAKAAAALPVPGARPGQQVPHVYMALQPEGPGKPISVVFAIDAARDNTPSDDPAVRITPENGLCNPQDMAFYNFPPQYAARPVVSELDGEEGLTAADLPGYMAIAVTNEMLNLGLAAEPEETRPQNVCTRKLWEQLVAAENAPARAAGQ